MGQLEGPAATEPDRHLHCELAFHWISFCSLSYPTLPTPLTTGYTFHVTGILTLYRHLAPCLSPGPLCCASWPSSLLAFPRPSLSQPQPQSLPRRSAIAAVGWRLCKWVFSTPLRKVLRTRHKSNRHPMPASRMYVQVKGQGRGSETMTSGLYERNRHYHAAMRSYIIE